MHAILHTPTLRKYSYMPLVDALLILAMVSDIITQYTLVMKRHLRPSGT